MLDYINYTGLGMAVVTAIGMILRATDNLESRPVDIALGVFAICWAGIFFSSSKSNNYPVVAGCLGVLIALITSLLLAD